VNFDSRTAWPGCIH